MMDDSTRDRIRAGLDQLRRSAPAWPYRPGGAPAAEPTALVGLAAWADDPASAIAREAADWLADQQQADGSLGVSATLHAPGWATPYALLSWSALGTRERERRRAAAWLLSQHGRTEANRPDSPIGHDFRIDGWTWAPATHAWIEPTALALLALRREGLSGHPRVRDGLRLIHDRAIPSGGWNYGNRIVFGHALRPQPGPTALALLALVGTCPRTPAIVAATAYLESGLAGLRAGWSLGFAWLALRAWGRDVRPTPADLDAAIALAPRRPNPTLALAALALAGAPRAIEGLVRIPDDRWSMTDDR
jgi:hypothetical protein